MKRGREGEQGERGDGTERGGRERGGRERRDTIDIAVIERRDQTLYTIGQ